jgi:hypothetical protein
VYAHKVTIKTLWGPYCHKWLAFQVLVDLGFLHQKLLLKYIKRSYHQQLYGNPDKKGILLPLKHGGLSHPTLVLTESYKDFQDHVGDRLCCIFDLYLKPGMTHHCLLPLQSCCQCVIEQMIRRGSLIWASFRVHHHAFL